MPTLILTLPLHAETAASEYDYVLSPDGQQLGSHGRAVASMLPATPGRGVEVVALVPAQALSWHRVALPDKVLRSMLSGRIDAARARTVLAGVLEEHLLDDAAALHLAVFAASPEGDNGNAWVAACDRRWLLAHLQALETAGLAADRIAAECAPLAAGSARLVVSDAATPAHMVLCTPQGVSPMALCDAGIRLAQATPDLEVWAEPAVMALAQQHFGPAALLQTRAQRQLLAAQTPWNLAQGDLIASARGRLAKRMGSGWQHLLHAPAWRPVRWTLLALLLVQVAVLNAQAWYQRSLLADTRSAAQAVLTQTFPDVQLVVDAPLQMQRAVDDLARARGQGAGTDWGRVLAVLAPQWPAGSALQGLEINERQMQLKANNLDTTLPERLKPALDSQGLRAQVQGGLLVIEPKEPR